MLRAAITSTLLALAVMATAGSAGAQDADVEIPAAPQPPKAPAAQAPSPPAEVPLAKPAPNADVEALRRELAETQARLDARIRELDAKIARAPAAPPPVKEPEGPSLLSRALPSDYLISAYVQAQYERHQDSQDEVQQGGSPLNQDRFLVRRGRIRLDAAWRFAELALEIDGNTTRGPTFGLRRAEASLLWRGTKPWSGKASSRDLEGAEPAPVMLTLGLTQIPFGAELVASARERPFMERTQGSLAFFPGEPDAGVRLSGGIGFFRYDIALLNGEPIDDRPGKVTRDLTGAKDLVARLGADVRPASFLRVVGGVSVLRGTGFHQGTEATKASVAWRDFNENGAIDAGELTGVPGAGATPSSTFTRWGLGVDLRLAARSMLGWSTLSGEVTLGSNLDRGLFPADPVTTGIDARELAYHAAFVQELTPWALAGFRFDGYDPNADFLGKQAGKLIPTSQVIHTLSPLVGLALPGRARLSFQYDVVRDSLAKDARGVPVDLRNDRWTLRLQVNL